MNPQSGWGSAPAAENGIHLWKSPMQRALLLKKGPGGRAKLQNLCASVIYQWKSTGGTSRPEGTENAKNAKNAEELVSKVNVDGGLIGGASLKAADFSVIVKAASNG